MLVFFRSDKFLHNLSIHIATVFLTDTNLVYALHSTLHTQRHAKLSPTLMSRLQHACELQSENRRPRQLVTPTPGQRTAVCRWWLRI